MLQDNDVGVTTTSVMPKGGKRMIKNNENSNQQKEPGKVTTIVHSSVYDDHISNGISLKDVWSMLHLINEDLSGKHPQADDFLYIEAHTNGYVTLIKFMGLELWNSEDDVRIWKDEETQEDIETYVRRALNNVLLDIGKIRI